MTTLRLSWAEERMRTSPVPTVSASYTALPPAPTSSSPVIVGLKAGQPAPFTGILLNPAAAAKIAVDAESAKAQCDIETKRKLDTQAANYDEKLADKDSEIKYTRDALGATIKAREQEIADLRKHAVDDSGSHVWWAVGGGAAGVALTVVIVFLVSEAKK